MNSCAKADQWRAQHGTRTRRGVRSRCVMAAVRAFPCVASVLTDESFRAALAAYKCRAGTPMVEALPSSCARCMVLPELRPVPKDQSIVVSKAGPAFLARCALKN